MGALAYLECSSLKRDGLQELLVSLADALVNRPPEVRPPQPPKVEQEKKGKQNCVLS